MNPTPEQQNIIQSLKTHNNIKVFAYAGSGKTTTLKMLTQYYSRYRFLYLAFNRSIATEAKSKFPFNTDVRTTHSLARYMVSGDIDTDNIQNKYRVLDVLDIYEDIDNYLVAKLILDGFNGYCHSSFSKIDQHSVYQIIARNKDSLITYRALKKYNPNLLEDITEKIQDFWNKMLEGQLKITHDFYLKYFELNLEKYKHKFKWDCILLDEAQDTNDATLSIFEKIPAKKKIMVGDVYQKIYGFRGSINAMEKWNADVELHLSQTFRFPRKIADEANKILLNLRKEPVLIKTVKEDEEAPKITSLAYLSRTNSKLIEVAYKLIQEKVKFNTIRPVEEISRLPVSVLGFMTGNPHLIKEKWINRFSSLEELQEFAEDIDDVELKSAILTAEKFGNNLLDIVEYMRKMEKLKTNIFLATAHSAKGLEWDKVVVLDDFPDLIDLFIEANFPSIKAFQEALKNQNKKALEIAEEINLLYVAITRAKKDLKILTVNKDYYNLTDEEFSNLIYERMKQN